MCPIIATLILAIALGCTQDPQDIDRDFPDPHAVRAEGLVSVHWVKKLLEHGESPATHPRPATYRNDQFVIVEASWNPRDKGSTYRKGHLPGAISIDTDELETGYPEWKLRDPTTLQAILGRKGISPKSTVIVYGDQLIAAARVWWIMKYVGIDDVRLMDGNLRTWRTAGYSPETTPREREPTEFIASVRHEWIATTEDVRSAHGNSTTQLVDVRSSAEFSGRKSGYSYLEAKGRIPGAVHGGDADDTSGLYRRADGRLRSTAEIRDLWKSRGVRVDEIDEGKRRELVFYCGSGWRSSVAFFYAWMMGHDTIRNYSDGWCGWSTQYQHDADAKGNTPGWRQVPLDNPRASGR